MKDSWSRIIGVWLSGSSKFLLRSQPAVRARRSSGWPAFPASAWPVDLPTRPPRLSLPAKLEAIRDREQHRLDPLVLSQLPVQPIDGPARGLPRAATAQPPAPQHVVEQNQPVPAHAWQNQFVVSVVFGFVRVDEGEIKVRHTRELLQRADRV